MLSISVVVPAWNCARYLPDALASVAAQSRQPAEVLVVDDASADDTVAVARALGARVIRLERNSGPSAARNAGIRAASGEAIAFLDGDDWWEPDHLERVAGLLDRFPAAGVAFGRSSRVVTRYAMPLPPECDPFDAIGVLCRGNPIPQSAAVVRRELLLGVDGYRTDMRYSEDYDLWLRLAARTQFVCTNHRTLNYRTHEAQLSRHEAPMAAAAWAARQRAWSALPATLTPAQRAFIAHQLAAGWEADLQTAWHIRDEEPLATLLAQHALVPGSEAIRQRWNARVRWFRGPWLIAARGWDRLPEGFRRWVRRAPVAPAAEPPMVAAVDPQRIPALAERGEG